MNVSYELVSKMNGTIKIESEVNIGTKAYFSLPLTMTENEKEVEDHARGCRGRNNFLDCSNFVDPSLIYSSFPSIQSEAESRQEIYTSDVNLDIMTISNECVNSSRNYYNVHEERKENVVSPNSQKILIVDDNSVNILSLRLLLNRIHIQTDSVYIYIHIYIYIRIYS